MSGLKVLHVYRTYFPDPPGGGLQEAIRQICLAVQPLGIENTIFTLSPDPLPAVMERPEARVVRERSWAAPASCDLGGSSAFLRFRELAREADLVHYLFPWPFADVLHRVVPRGKPVVLTYISDIVRQRLVGRLYAPLMWKTLGEMRAVVANAPSYAQTSPVLSDVAVRDRVHVIPLGIDERSYPEVGDDSIFQKLRLDEDEPYFLFIGVLRYYKGLHSLVRAAGRVGARIVIAGSGPEESPLRSQVAVAGARNVLFAGQVSDEEKVALIGRCRALVLPSHLRSEAFGMVLVEAAMFGKPMITCEIGTGTSFVNSHAETGFVVPPDNPGALADAMNRLIEDMALAESMGRAARSRYERMFSGEALGREYARLFQECVGK
ncbi:MAG: N-acetyl-alpha-D-glucosaminyl-diphospho-ditrans,octacis-undecaprenol 3-alpha-mannosyltransferase / rhamnosyltransferase [Azoarcus sp.]|nr:N-acetyl-alpha-D-glucosaminyl-diphospho-ditrans,octacis-undecaprenol 3-alpha-mannosyltransferase / rhamnosyltransferase [Azoarcus sp.]